MTKKCPAFPPIFIDRYDYNLKNTSLILSTPERTEGTVVRLSCKGGYVLNPDNPTINCLSTGKWDFTPECINVNLTRTVEKQTAAGGLTSNQKIIIGVAGGIGLLFFIVLLILLIAIIRRRRRDELERKQTNQINSDRRASTNSFALVNNSRPYAHNSFGRNAHLGGYSNTDMTDRNNPGKVFREDQSYDSRYADEPTKDRNYPGKAFREDELYDSRSRGSDFRKPAFWEETRQTQLRDDTYYREGRSYENRGYRDNPASDRSYFK